MDFLVNAYDWVLIYYPNIFLPAIFLFFSLTSIAVIVLIVLIVKKSALIIVVKNSKHIKNSKYAKAQSYKYFFLELLIKIPTMVDSTELKIKNILKKVGKEILIDE